MMTPTPGTRTAILPIREAEGEVAREKRSAFLPHTRCTRGVEANEDEQYRTNDEQKVNK